MIESLLKCLTTMVLSLTMKDVRKMGRQFDQWAADAEPLIRKHGVLKDFKSVSARFKKSGWELTEDMAEDMGYAMKGVMPKFVADTSISHEQLALLRDLSLYLRQDSPPALSRISKSVSMLGDPALSSLFLEEEQDDVADMSIVQNMERIVFQVTKRKKDPILTVNEMRQLAEDNKKLAEKYKVLRAQFKANYTKALLKFVRLSGKPLVDVKRAADYLNAMGCNYLPEGFVGKVDEKGKLYTTAGKALHGTMFGKMKMNPAYDPKTDDTYYAKLVGDMRGELRTQDFLRRSKTVRMEKVGEFADAIDQHRKQWLKQLDSLDTRDQMVAAIIECVHLVHARIGSEAGKNKGEKTYGISVLRRNQIKFTPTGVKMRYPGKKGTINTHSIKPTSPSSRKLIKLLRTWAEGKGPTDKLFVAGGTAVTSRDVNAYLKTIGVPVTIHKFRHAIATRTAKDMLDKAPFSKKNPGTQAAVEKWVKTEAVRIGEMLHHRTGSGDEQKTTSNTAIAAYIDPKIIADFFRGLGHRAPKWLPKFDE